MNLISIYLLIYVWFRASFRIGYGICYIGFLWNTLIVALWLEAFAFGIGCRSLNRIKIGSSFLLQYSTPQYLKCRPICRKRCHFTFSSSVNIVPLT